MEGFISVTATKNGDIERDQYGNLKIKDGCAHSVATYFYKLKVDKKNDVYIDSQLGAVVGNIDVDVKSIEELEKFKDKKTGFNPYQRFIDMKNEGYDLVVNMPFPHQHGGNGRTERGVYCKNYLDMIEKENQSLLTN